MSDSEGSLTRRTIVRSGVAGVATVLAPEFVQVTSAATDSGSVEVQTTATVPTNTSLSITVFEDMDGDGTAERQQTESVPDGTNTLVYDVLQGTEAQGITYWLELNLSTSDGSVTPSLDSATLTLPEAEQTPASGPVNPDKKNPGEIWESFLVFVGFITMFFAGLAGLGSRSMAVGATAAYVVFGYIAIQTGHTLLTNILYVSLVVVIIGMALKMWRMEFGGDI